ncbi:hypothetical protein GWA97_10835 [Flavobacterium sp. LaA7.5]|nr:hypothetical protein [Flavobacterium salilacus subsp. altitudinum]
MKDLIKDILETSRDRIKTPITGSFALAFLLWNWRPILVLLLSDNSIEDKIKHIDKNYCNYWALLIPLVIAVVYVIAVPYIMAGLEWLTKIAIEKRKSHKGAQSLFDLKITKKIAKEEFELTQVRSGQRDISELNDRIAELNTQIETQNTQHKTQVENYEKLIEGYEESEIKNKALLDKYLSEIKESKKSSENLTGGELMKINSFFTNEEKKKFIDFCDFFIYKKEGSGYEPIHGTLSIDLERKFKRHNMIIDNGDNTYSISNIGEYVYDFFKIILDINLNA